jgi:Glycosyl transferase family 11
MVIVRLVAGLGNQMFQYALGRHLSILRRQDLLLDTSVLARPNSNRTYQLDCFNIHGQATNDLSYLRQLEALWMVRELRFGFNADVLNCQVPNIQLQGLWQTDKYFREISELIRRDFTFKDVLAHEHLYLHEQAAALNSVCLHVRRKDYLNPGNNMVALDPDFYRRACDYIATRVNEPHFFIFSDDLDWCHKTLNIPYSHSFSSPDPGGVNHLRLMSHCKHFIIANSTYSWWAAWLGSWAEKLVIAPSSWFVHEREWNPDAGMQVSSDDLTPTEWIRL